MSHLYPPAPNPSIKRDSEIDLLWTKRERQTEVCKACFVKGCERCNGTGFVMKEKLNKLFKN